MSIALSTARASVRQLIRDVDVSAPAVKGYVLDQALSNHYQLTHARLYVPLEWQTITALAVADADYTLTTPEFHTVGLFRLASNHNLIEKITPQAMAAMRNGSLRDAVLTHTGEPIALAITEELPASVGATETTFQVYPTPTETDTLEGLYAAIGGTLAADADKLQLGQNGQRAVEYSAAAELLAGMTEDTAKRLDVNSRQLAKEYKYMAEQFILWELTRASRRVTSRHANRSYKGW